MREVSAAIKPDRWRRNDEDPIAFFGHFITLMDLAAHCNRLTNYQIAKELFEIREYVCKLRKENRGIRKELIALKKAKSK